MIAKDRTPSHDWLEVVCYLTAAYLQIVSGACSIDYYCSPPQKRLMSPENSTRKVNTILKCQEINDIVLSSYGPAGEGDKCLALFTPFLPICDLSFPLPLLLFVFVSVSLLFSISCFFPPSVPFVSSSFSSADHGLQMPRTYPHHRRA